MTRVLLIEDDPATLKVLRMAFEPAGIMWDEAHLGEDGVQIGKVYNYDLIILDLMLPDTDGYSVLMRFRSSKIRTPVMILSGLNSPEDKAKGLACGADDYLGKPFIISEFMERVKALIRRSKGHYESIIRFDKVTVDLDTRSVKVAGKPVRLTIKEYGILELLAMRKGIVLSKETFLNHLYNGMDEPEIKIIDVFICKLRKKLAAASGTNTNYIETVWGRGYMLKDYSNSSNNKEDEMDIVTPDDYNRMKEIERKRIAPVA